jgi:methionyl-tRNA formyltransferase
VQHAILHGDDLTGATTFRLVRELDAGPVFGVLTETIQPTDTGGELLQRLAVAGADLMVATLDGIESGELEAREQPTDGVSLAPKITTDDAKVDWDHPAVAVSRRIRACTPEPGAWTELAGTRVKLWPVTVLTASAGAQAPGEVRALRDRVVVGTATAPVELGEVQQDGKRRMPAADWARGLRLGGQPASLG